MQNQNNPVPRLLKFRADYLAIDPVGKKFAVSEPSENRYLPNNPAKFSENLLQLIWRNGLYESGDLKTTRGLALKVISPGRLNRSAGPDFKNALFMIGGEEIRGHVEIHKDSKEWFEHGHNSSHSYNNTVLHVFARKRDETPPAKTAAGKELPELEIGLYLRHRVETLYEELETVKNPVSGRTMTSAPCGKIMSTFGSEALGNLLDLIGDGRMLMKSNRVMDRLENADPENTLYEMVFESMGHSMFNEQFGTIARNAGFLKLAETAEKNPGVPANICAQSIYLKLAGILDQSGNQTKVEFVDLLKRVKIGAIEPLFASKEWRQAGCRPANFPERRLAALSHIAERGLGGNSISDFFDKVLANLGTDAPPSETRTACKKLMGCFTDISDSFWDLHYSLFSPVKKPKKLIGKDKAISIVTDCLIPFHLAHCRAKSDTVTEHKLVMIFKSLPPPAASGITDYMARNMLGEKRVVAKPLRRQQALLQLYKDFCHRAPADCASCAFVEYLRALNR
ncbi:MAG: DUF2851 family protein [Nitrospinae bacterium]|nr:DUF2851 family protein [Nitrospinota bacterium]